jgi:Holliday junction resolvase RusA-like endonuclease
MTWEEIEYLTIEVGGIPKPAGSKRYVGKTKANKPIIIEDNPGTVDWKKEVKQVAASKMRELDLPVYRNSIQVSMTFIQVRPKSHYGTGRRAGILKGSAPRCPIVKPDLTKLVRGTEDALKGIVWYDDCLVVRQINEKIYGEHPGVVITVEPF